MSDWPLLAPALAGVGWAAFVVIDGWTRKRLERRNALRALERAVVRVNERKLG